MSANRVLYLLGQEHVEIREEQIPEPGKGELLIRVEAATTCGTDLKVYRRGGHPRMLTPPCPFGHEMSGVISRTGAGVKDWRDGDPVVISNSAPCGQCVYCRAGRENLCDDLHYLNGAYAEAVLIPERFVRRATYRRPDGLEPAVAALTEPLACVLHGLSRCPAAVSGGAAVLGGGPIGLMFVAELARRGYDVVLGDLIPKRLQLGQRLGANKTVLLTGETHDSELLQAATGELGTPLVIEATGVPAAWSTAMETVAVGGTVVLFGGCAPGIQVACDTHRLHYSEITVAGVYHHRPTSFRAALERLAEHSQDLALLIDEEHPLEGVEGALRRMADRKILKACIRP
jgi:L-iditol 2-dehydrogenase